MPRILVSRICSIFFMFYFIFFLIRYFFFFSVPKKGKAKQFSVTVTFNLVVFVVAILTDRCFSLLVCSRVVRLRTLIELLWCGKSTGVVPLISVSAVVTWEAASFPDQARLVLGSKRRWNYVIRIPATLSAGVSA